MANIEDYIDWRGDITFDYDPFNVVDNLILSQFAYIDFEGVFPEGREWYPLTLKECSDRFFALHTEEEILARTTSTKMMPFVMRQAAETKRFSGVRVLGYENHLDTEKSIQMSVVTFLLDNFTAYVAFRGTDNSFAGWKEDFELSYSSETGGQTLAVEYLNRNFSKTNMGLYVGGHSKGGNFAIYAGAFCEPAVRRQIAVVFANDAPGFREEVTDTPGYREIAPRIVSIIPEESIIGTLLETAQVTHIVRSSAKGIMQHAARSWQVKGNHFEETESRSESSLMVESTLEKWINEVDDEQRMSFVEALFSLLDSTGKSSFGEMSKDKFGAIQTILQTTINMPKEERAMFLDVLWRLVRSGTDTALDSLKKQAKKLVGLPEEEQEKLLPENSGDDKPQP